MGVRVYCTYCTLTFLADICWEKLGNCEENLPKKEEALGAEQSKVNNCKALGAHVIMRQRTCVRLCVSWRVWKCGPVGEETWCGCDCRK